MVIVTGCIVVGDKGYTAVVGVDTGYNEVVVSDIVYLVLVVDIGYIVVVVCIDYIVVVEVLDKVYLVVVDIDDIVMVVVVVVVYIGYIAVVVCIGYIVVVVVLYLVSLVAVDIAYIVLRLVVDVVVIYIGYQYLPSPPWGRRCRVVRRGLGSQGPHGSYCISHSWTAAPLAGPT